MGRKTPLLMDASDVLILETRLAVLIGDRAAIALHQIHYWLDANENTERITHLRKDGKYWTYNTWNEWRDKNFPFWSTDTIKRIFEALRDEGLIKLEPHDDRQKGTWVRIDYDALNKRLEGSSENGGRYTQVAGRGDSKLRGGSTQIAPSTGTTEDTETNTEIDSPNGAQRENSEEADNETSNSLSVVTPLESTPTEPKTRKSKTAVAAATPKPRDPIFDAIAYARFGTCDVDKDTAKFVGNLRAAAWGAYQNQRAAHIAHLTQEQKVELCAKGIQRFEREWKQIKDSEGNPLRTISNRATYAEKFFAFLAEHPVGNAQPTQTPQAHPVSTTATPPRFSTVSEPFAQVSEGGDNE